MDIGKKIIIEIGKRGLKGYFFTHEQYQELKTANDLDDAKNKIKQFGYPSVMEAESAKEVVNKLKKETHRKDRNGCLLYAALETIFWIVLSLATCS